MNIREDYDVDHERPGGSQHGADGSAITLCGVANAKDAAGCKDPDGSKRFDGSRLLICDYRRFDEYVMPAGKLIDKPDFTGKVFESKLDVEGRIDL